MLEINHSDIKSIVFTISNHIKFLCEKKIITVCEYYFDTSVIEKRNDKVEEDLLYYINLFFIDPIRKRIDKATSIREHRDLISELKFLTDEISVIVDTYVQHKIKNEEERQKEYSFGVEKFLRNN